MLKNLLKILPILTFISMDVSGAEPANEWMLFFGHFHPLVLHLPIGILIVAILFQFLATIPRFNALEAAIEVTLLLGMISAIIAAILGYFLSLNGEYGGSILTWHKWLGIGLAALTAILYIIKRKNVNPMIVKISMLVLLLVLTATGHYGGMLTHGENYLSTNLPSSLKSLFGAENGDDKITYNFTDVEEALVYEDLITPVFTTKCVSCHNGNKIKGGLRLDTKDGLMKGGENGEVIGASLDQSELIRLVHLPLEDEKHMPPKGKKQLTDDEVLLLAWWVKNGAEFETSVNKYAKDDDISLVLNNIEELANETIHPVYTQEMDDPDINDLQDLQKNGIIVNKVASESPFLEARVAQIPDGLSSLLRKVENQLVWLNMARSNCQSKDLLSLPEFKNITKLQLQQTDIDDDALSYIADLEYLEYLNIYGTKVTDEGIDKLSQLKHLKSLYLWDTQVTAEAIAKLQQAVPTLLINGGVDKNESDTVRLAKPLIVSEKTIFNESTTVSLSLGFEGVEIYYTLDGSIPGRESQKYAGPIAIENTCKLQAIAVREGWGDSNVAETDFIRVKYIIDNIYLKNDPSARYAGNGANTLADGEKGGADFRSGKWLGFEEIDLIADLDLGGVKQPKEVIVSCLEEIGSYIFFPRSLSVETSIDGKQYRQAKDINIGVPKQSRPNSLKHFALQLGDIEARYLRVKVSNVGHCPDWHPGAGDKAWVFIDEIVVN